jgi:hypothetical protein
MLTCFGNVCKSPGCETEGEELYARSRGGEELRNGSFRINLALSSQQSSSRAASLRNLQSMLSRVKNGIVLVAALCQSTHPMETGIRFSLEQRLKRSNYLSSTVHLSMDSALENFIDFV